MNSSVLYKKIRGTAFSMQHWLAMSCMFSCVLLAARISITGNSTYLFMTWNLFLGIVPYIISQWLSQRVQFIESRMKLSLILLTWLLFIPNSFYIFTDLFHLEKFDAAPKWFDLLLLFSFAWNGLLFGVLSVRRVELILQLVTGRGFSVLVIFVVMWLNAFGIYIGRYLRFNSWDVVAQPFRLFGEMLEILLHPFQRSMEWGMIGIYALFMTLLYFTLKKMGEHIQMKQS